MKDEKMKIMSFNTQHCLNYLEQKIDFDTIAKVITDFGADVIGLNEIRGEGEHADYTAQTERLAALTGMKYYYFAPALDVPGGGPYGNAILSRIPFVKVENVPIPDPCPKKYKGYYETRCVLKAELEGGITVLVTHFGLNPDEQENAVKTVLDNLAKNRCVLMGDFNVTPESELLDPIREKLTDTAKYFSEPKQSFPSDKPDRKIDYIFVSSDIEVKSADIPAIVASDHRPYVAEIDFK